MSDLVLTDPIQQEIAEEFSFFGDWSERWEDSQLTPLSIQLELDMSEESRIDWPLLEVVMMVDGGATRGFNAGFLPSG